ncbi:hypothetical protein FGO68_gene16626 [Halteria grandinella]|uniref:Uncharacterized protein n=1 Tax=Halteria grandinella TaxID=5974 RepID=A0A8J8P2L3_HALGN|nr:hypothetical protein FGO68_gene16626 [Halteria grandinella]
MIPIRKPSKISPNVQAMHQSRSVEHNYQSISISSLQISSSKSPQFLSTLETSLISISLQQRKTTNQPCKPKNSNKPLQLRPFPSLTPNHSWLKQIQRPQPYTRTQRWLLRLRVGVQPRDRKSLKKACQWQKQGSKHIISSICRVKAANFLIKMLQRGLCNSRSKGMNHQTLNDTQMKSQGIRRNKKQI